MTQEKNEQANTFKLIFAGIGIPGCVTVLILGAAVLIGLYLDKAFDSAKHLFTVGLIILSVPATIVGLLWAVRYTTARFIPAAEDENAEEKKLQEDADSGAN